MNSSGQPFRVTVLGQENIADSVSSSSADDETEFAVTTITPEALPTALDSADCLLIDQQSLASSLTAITAEIAAERPSLPIIILLEELSETAIVNALDAGAIDFLPRSICRTRPDLLRRKLESYTGNSSVDGMRSREIEGDNEPPVAILRPDSAEVITTNQSLTAVLDLEPGELQEREIRLDSEGSETLPETVRLVAETGTERTCEFVVCRQDEACHHFVGTLRAVPGRASERVVLRYDGPVENNTQNQPERTDERFEMVTESVDEIIYIANEDLSEIQYVSPAYEDICGRPVEELYADATSFLQNIDARDREAFETDFAEMVTDLKQGTPADSYEFEFRVRRPDDSVRWVHAIGYPVAGETGNRQYVGIIEDITEKRQLEHSYRELFENVSDGIVVHEPETGKITDANRRFCELTGYERDELIGETAALFTDDDSDLSPERVKEYVRLAKEAGSQLFEWESRRKNGETVPVEVNLQHTSLRGQERVLASVRDVKDRRERQVELEAERDQRSVLFENMPDPIMSVVFQNDKPYITEVNDAFEDAFGVTGDTALDRPITDIIVPNDEYETYEEILERVLAGQTVEEAVRRKTATGIRDYILRVLPFEVGTDRHAYVWYTDVTERHERERAIEEERQKYSTLVEQSTDGVAVVRDGSYEFVNDRFVSITGYDEDELLEIPFEQAFAPEYRDVVTERYQQRISGDSPPSQYDVEVETPDGERRVLELAVSRIQHNGEAATMANFRDVTERRHREQTIERLQTATERLQSADTSADVYRITVETARDVLGLSVTAAWRHDDKSQRLVYEYGTDSDGWLTEGQSSFTPENKEYELFEDGDTTVYDISKHHDRTFLGDSILLPIGEFGLLVAGNSDSDTYEPYIIDILQVLAGHTASALERVHRTEELRESEHRLQAIINRIDEAIFLAPVAEIDKAESSPDFVSSGYEEIWGQPLETLDETLEEGFFSTLHPSDYDRYRTLVSRISDDVRRGDEQSRYEIEYRIQRPDGDTRWVQSEFYPTEWVDDDDRIIIVSRDVTTERERDRQLESFHDASAKLTTAENATEAGQLAVEAAADVFDLPATAVYQYDTDRGCLVPSVTGPGVDGVQTLPALTAADGAWQAFVDEQMSRVETGVIPEIMDEKAHLFPLGNNGLLVVWQSAETFDADAASILAATLEASLNRLRGEKQLESRRAELEEQTKRASRLEAIAELTQRVEAAITTESTRQGIEEAVCAELTDVEPFASAWIAEAEIGTDRLTSRAVSGITRDDVDKTISTIDAPNSDRSPASDVWQSGEQFVDNDLVGGRNRAEWHQTLLREGAGSVCAIPLSYNGVTHGVLTVVANEPDAFGDRELEVLTQLGVSIGYAITAAERRRALESDDTVELEFWGTDTELNFANFAKEFECQISHRRTVYRQDGSVSVYYELKGQLPADIETAAENVLPGNLSVVSQQESTAVIERRGSSWFGSFISDYGGVLRRSQADTEGVSLVVELPSDADTRTLVEHMHNEIPGIELTAQRQHRETLTTPHELYNQLEQRLSERQQESLETAHAMGYFDWPRESSGEDVAESLGITQPTVNKHIRLGEQKVFNLLFGSESVSAN